MFQNSNSKTALLVNVGTGNIHSVHKVLQFLGFSVRLTSDPQDLAQPARIVLPGVGAFGSFMEGLQKEGLQEAILAAVKRGDPLIGICVGMQALFESGHEKGTFGGLGLLKGKVVRFPDMPQIKVPHTGWNQLHIRPGSRLFRGVPEGTYAYFNHSYYCDTDDAQVISSQTEHGLRYTSAVEVDNLFGVQFHPEKSQLVGQKILANFLTL